jgi:uncharacterized membrane protein
MEMKDQGTLYQNCSSIITGSVAYSVNAKTQIVGSSFCFEPAAQDAVLWEQGETLFDLNRLIPASSNLHLVNAFGINDRGEITGFGVLPNGDAHAFLLTPCGEGAEGCGSEAASATTPAVDNSTLTTAQGLAIRRMMAGSHTLFSPRHVPGRGRTKD